MNFICRQLNDLYGGYQYKREWMIRATNVVKADYDSYIKMLRRLWNDIQNDPVESQRINKGQLAMSWDGKVYEHILADLD